MLFNSFKNKIKFYKKGFSLVEVVFASAIFAIVAMSIYQGLSSITRLVAVSRDKVVVADLINSEFELVRNLSFVNVGLIGGIPTGFLSPTTTVNIDGREFIITRTIRNVDDPFDGTIGGSPNDLSPADYKLVEIRVICNTCRGQIDFRAHTRVAPKNLESASTNGALFVRVFDANGNPLPQADVSVVNPSVGVYINDTTNNSGVLQIVDAPPSQNLYRITVGKTGFTSDRTYATSTSNPNPIKLDATVLLQQLTQISFIIDKVSNANIRTITDKCVPVSDVPFNMIGTKLIGTSPDVYKWSPNLSTDSSGIKNITDLEWDVFTFSVSGGHYLAGTNPIYPLSILPNSSQNIDLIITDKTPSFLLVSVKDASTGLPISGANVTLYKSGFNRSLITDQGYINQTDWSSGEGQLNFSDPAKFHSSDGNIDYNNPSGELRLTSSLGVYASSGYVTSSIFDTGTSSNWSRVDILPTDEPPSTGVDSVKFQIATSPDNTATTTWQFLGPDGTNATFYTTTNNSINPIHDGDRYIRYKLFLSTADTSVTPNISDFVISFASSCIPPGQVLFDSLINNNTYSMDVSATGYTSQTITGININSNWQKQDILLSP